MTQNFKYSIFLFGIFLSGCSLNLPIPMNLGTNYKYDMQGTINGIAFNGVAVIPKAPIYNMELTAPFSVDLLTLSSCHRDMAVKSNRKFQYIYSPVSGIEDRGSCLVRIGAYNKGSGRVIFGVLDFETLDESLPSTNICNGVEAKDNGVSICQARVGLYQVIKFVSPVKLAPNSSCKFTPNSDGTAWGYLMPKGECVSAFMEIAVPNRLHRHTSIGYDDIAVRE